MSMRNREQDLHGSRESVSTTGGELVPLVCGCAGTHSHLTTVNDCCFSAGAAILPGSYLQHFALQEQKSRRDPTGMVASLGKSEEAQEGAFSLYPSTVTEQDSSNVMVYPCYQFGVSYQMWLLFETPELFKNGHLCTGWPAWLTLKNQAREGRGGMGGWRF